MSGTTGAPTLSMWSAETEIVHLTPSIALGSPPPVTRACAWTWGSGIVKLTVTVALD